MSSDSDHTHTRSTTSSSPSTTFEATKAFYAAAFGWEFADYGPDYAGIQVDGREVGGLSPHSEVRPGSPLVILYSDDLEATVAEAVSP